MSVDYRISSENPRGFTNFVYLIWHHLALPEPTPVQVDICDFLQNGGSRTVIEAFRGVGKSYLTCAYVTWILLNDPEHKIMVISASKQRADDFSTFAQRLIMEVPILGHLMASNEQRWSKVSFDVGPSQASGSPSVKSVGITGQLTGSRANLIILDDVEVPNNSMTVLMRERLAEAVKEADAVLSPNGRIMYLGTPQTEQSLYNTLTDRGYKMRVWPARFPSLEKARDSYGDRLAPMIQKGITEVSIGQSTDPKRFTNEDLTERELSYGRSGFAMQFQLDTSLSDADKYPLKLADLIVMPIDRDKAAQKPMYGHSRPLNELPNVGLRGDRFFAPEALEGSYEDFTGSVLAIDPSGRGADETSYAVVKMLNGFLYVPACGGISGGYEESALTKLANIAKDHKVNYVLVESNFGDGMFSELLKPYLRRIYPVSLEEVRHSQQKEVRIIDTLEPIMNQHRLIIDPKVIQGDYDSVQGLPPEKAAQYMLTYQMTHITALRGALKHDDRLDALAMAVAYWTEQMASDVDEQMQALAAERLQHDLENFINSQTKSSLTWT